MWDYCNTPYYTSSTRTSYGGDSHNPEFEVRSLKNGIQKPFATVS